MVTWGPLVLVVFGDSAGAVVVQRNVLVVPAAVGGECLLQAAARSFQRVVPALEKLARFDEVVAVYEQVFFFGGHGCRPHARWMPWALS